MNFFNNVDAREELELIFQANHIKVLYVRSNKNTRCDCYNDLHKDGDSKCKKCGGTGLLTSIEIMDVFENPSSNDDMIKMSGEKHTELGNANIYSKTLYLSYDSSPSVGDRILIIGYDKHNMPTTVNEVLNINLCRGIRGINGRLEYYKAITRTSPQNKKLEQDRLNSLSNLDKKNLMKGVRYSWGS